MFGYLQPDKPELKVRDFELYKAAYCGLCRHLGMDYGIAARLTLSYDCTVLAMLYMSLNEEICTVSNERCTCNPLKKCLFCDSGGKAFEFAGAISVIMYWYKLQDTIKDSGMMKKIAAALLRSVLRRNYKKAAEAYPEIDRLTAEMMDQQMQAEQQQAGIDRSAEPTAKLISKICMMFSPTERENHILEVFGYYLGRWIYLMDAADDLEKDIKSDSFNPFKTKHNGNITETMNYCNEVLNMTAAQIVMAYDLLTPHSYKNILDNIIYEGIPNRQKECLFDKYDKRNAND